MLGFSLAGMMTGGLMQADVTAYEVSFGLNHERVSFWMSLFSLVTAVGGGLAGMISDKFDAARVYRACIVLSGAGLLFFVCPVPCLTLFGFLTAGLGMGGLIVGNILVSQDDAGAPNRAINRLHAAHCSARLIGVGLSIYATSVYWQRSYLILGSAFLILAAAYSPARVSRPGSAPHLKTDGDAGVQRMSGPAAWAVMIGFLLYMTAEMVLITWLPAYFEKDRAWSAANSKAAYGIFLAGLIAGRLFYAKTYPVEFATSACRNLAFAHVAALAVFLVLDAPAAAAFSLLIAGWCEGPGWPSLFAFSIRRSAGKEGKITGLIYVVSCVGIILATAGSGILAERVGLRSIFYVVACAHLLFSAVFYGLLRAHAAKA